MKLIGKKSETAFQSGAIKVGYIIYAKHVSWMEGKSGVVSSVTDKKIIVQFHPGIGNVTNHYVISIEEVVAGDWQIRWSKDLSKVYEYKMRKESSEDDIRRVDL